MTFDHAEETFSAAGTHKAAADYLETAMTKSEHKANVYWFIVCKAMRSLAWSNEFGWVSDDSYDLFDSDERARLRLPIGGEWVDTEIAYEPSKPSEQPKGPNAMTFDHAEETFSAAGTHKAAADYLETAMTYAADDMIGDDTFLDVCADIAAFLRANAIKEV
jgi:hypothetical protein